MDLGIGIAVLAVGWLIGYLGGLGKTDKLETQLNNTRRANYHLQEDVKLLKAENRELKKTNNFLSKYQDIVDAKAEAKSIREKTKLMQAKAEEKLNDMARFFNDTIYRAEKKLKK